MTYHPLLGAATGMHVDPAASSAIIGQIRGVKFDFVRRAMPHIAPKSLTNNEVYALTAYILRLNKLVDEDSVLNRENLALVEMPAFNRFIQHWQTSK